MTANELADELDKSRQKPYTSEHLVGKAANMLRQFGLAESIIKQQQLEIEALKKELAHQHRWNGDVDFARAILKKASEK